MNDSKNKTKSYNTIIEFSKFLRDNCDKLFEKDCKLCVKVDQLIILQEYLQPIAVLTGPSNSLSNQLPGDWKKNKASLNSKEFLILYKSNHLHFIQDFLFKITNLKIIGSESLKLCVNLINLNIFGSLTYLEIKNCQVHNIVGLQNLRNQLEILICIKCITKVQDVLHLCGGDQSMPITWPKLHTLNLSYNKISFLDNSFRLATSIEILDLSHNNLKDCGEHLHNLKKLKKINLSFNKLESFPSICDYSSDSSKRFSIQNVDLSYNNIEKISAENLLRLATTVEEINLTNNLINDLSQLNQLRLLTNVKHISIQRNPICLNPSSEFLLLEILSVTKLKKNSKNIQNVQSDEINGLNQVSTIQANTIPKYNVTNVSSSTNIFSLPSENSKLYLSDNFICSREPLKIFQQNKKRLKPNNILIEQDNNMIFSKNYLVPEKHDINESDTASSSKSADINTHYSTSVGTIYDPNKLQLEIENLKKMRLSYGTDWLLSTPNLKQNKALNENDSLKSTHTNTSSTKEKVIIDDNLEKESEIGRAIESFAVYRYYIDETNILSDQKIICILSIHSRYLIERDETNTVLFNLSKFSELADIIVQKDLDNDNTNKIKINFKNSKTSKVYEFENDQELHNFIQCLHKVLFNSINLNECELYYCSWCHQFAKKSKFKFFHKNADIKSKENSIEVGENDPNENDFSNLTCTKCNKFLIKDGKIQTIFNQNESFDKQISNQNKNIIISTLNNQKSVEYINENANNKQVAPTLTHSSTSSGLALKDVLRSFKTTNQTINNEIQNNLNNLNLSDLSTSESILITPDKNLSLNEENLDHQRKLEYILSNSQITRVKLDELSQQSKRINNNLKLFLIINILNETSKYTEEHKSNPKEDETLISIFKLNHIFKIKYDKIKKSVLNTTKFENCLCVFTSKNLILFKITHTELFDQNMEFEKCLRKEIIVEINKIEVIEIGMGQHYLIIETASDHDEQFKVFLKFVTFDFYQTQAFLNILLKTINDTKNFTMLKQIKKKNELTNKNLSRLLNKYQQLNLDVHILPIGFYAFLHDLKINENEPLQKYETSSKNIFLYNDEFLFLVEENLFYFNYEKQHDSNYTNQFDCISFANITDIVHLRLFKDFETKLEISFLDESNNSKQISWSFSLNKEMLVSQLINQLKLIWEKIFFIELPINF